jgi:NadR type nicotinamide-nucleotide adenylyltransferase
VDQLAQKNAPGNRDRLILGKMQPIKKIVVLGPESTGKSTLCEKLAAYFHTLWCPEYAREYLLTHGTSYRYDDLLTIAKGQLELEDRFTGRVEKQYAAQQGPPLLFIDTDMYVMKVWCEFVFEKCHQFILDQIVQRRYDAYLLCNIDLPWVKDELREYPNEQPRRELYHMYKDLLVHQQVPWAQINGVEEERFSSALEIVKKLLQK